MAVLISWIDYKKKLITECHQ